MGFGRDTCSSECHYPSLEFFGVIFAFLLLIFRFIACSRLNVAWWHSGSLGGVPPGHRKSWNLGRPFSRPGKSLKIAKVMENDDNVMEFLLLH